ncbi:hypothetical protein BY996DRAFT_6616221 [Phakopsora pachyrhizi]|uniref:Uncharacterized protein n=1 Tax=Phakopsora pachyrhizi TaxID=170000 RepID=A0AAV0B6C5_PHAPC|nr:hypothetical protein BY996DRAFT_6616221 [Phakopsora pachyrhizi]CAH7681852.1 hypothetical protein PPACK8108_LOCUS14512 [Phakopsora pachyrhizi]
MDKNDALEDFKENSAKESTEDTIKLINYVHPPLRFKGRDHDHQRAVQRSFKLWFDLQLIWSIDSNYHPGPLHPPGPGGTRTDQAQR